MISKILQYSFNKQLGHIPSALSMIDYLDIVFNYVNQDDIIVIGKPFGAQAYYIIWKEKGWIKDINNLHMGVKHDEIPFVTYSEETIGNALGVAAGIALTTNKKVYVNLSDAALQMGTVLEAIQFIGKHQLNILVTIDYNNMQVTGKVSDIIPVEPVYNFFRCNDWIDFETDGHDIDMIENVIERAYKFTIPTVVFCYTKKGNGIDEMRANPKQWHYRKLNEKDLTSFLNQIKK